VTKYVFYEGKGSMLDDMFSGEEFGLGDLF
jgi:hypothetical protein